MTKGEFKALGAERDRLHSQLAAIAEVKKASTVTPSTRADVELEPALRGRLEEVTRLLSAS